MHELGIAQEIVAIVVDHAHGARVTRVVVEVGKHTLLLPDSLRFCFDLCTEDTVAHGAELEIREIPGTARCRDCGTELTFDEPLGLCDCGSANLEWLSGGELKIKEMEVA